MHARENVIAFPAMLLRADTHDPMAVAALVRADYLAMFPGSDRQTIPRIFSWAIDCFTGRDPDFLPIDARYHDFEHTLQGTLCLTSLLRGRANAGALPAVDRETFELCILAILLHDTGYLKRRGDTTGTGAKYTQTHVNRSCEFAEALLISKGFSPEQVLSVKNMIRCTGMGANMTSIQFRSEAEKLCGFALGTADLLGQMAAEDYVEKLPILYDEFVESGRFNGNPGAVGFASAEDLMRKTQGFWEKYVLPKVENDFQGLFRHLATAPGAPGNGESPYLVRIQANMERLRRRITLAA
jgi:hypothetical protein